VENVVREKQPRKSYKSAIPTIEEQISLISFIQMCVDHLKSNLLEVILILCPL
jgi:hypothetical protein